MRPSETNRETAEDCPFVGFTGMTGKRAIEGVEAVERALGVDGDQWGSPSQAPALLR
jgi:hypothetical protein